MERLLTLLMNQTFKETDPQTALRSLNARYDRRKLLVIADEREVL